MLWSISHNTIQMIENLYSRKSSKCFVNNVMLSLGSYGVQPPARNRHHRPEESITATAPYLWALLPLHPNVWPRRTPGWNWTWCVCWLWHAPGNPHITGQGEVALLESTCPILVFTLRNNFFMNWNYACFKSLLWKM